MKKFTIFLLTFAIFFVNISSTLAQCAMCQQIVSSNLSDGRGSVIGRGINTGVLFLLTVPYLLIAFGIFFWYKSAKKNQIEKIALQKRLKEVLG